MQKRKSNVEIENILIDEMFIKHQQETDLELLIKFDSKEIDKKFGHE